MTVWVIEDGYGEPLAVFIAWSEALELYERLKRRMTVSLTEYRLVAV